MNVTVNLKMQSPAYYYVVSEKLYQPECGEYHTYGVQVKTHEYTEMMHDVCVCKKTAEAIVQHLNHHQVSPIHLFDIILDMLP